MPRAQRERRLRTKRKRRYSGKAIRLSNDLLAWMDARRRGHRSYDAFLRRYFGMPDWRGTPQPLIEGVLETTSGQFFLRTGTWAQAEAVARGAAVVEAARRRTRKVNKPLRMRELRPEQT